MELDQHSPLPWAVSAGVGDYPDIVDGDGNNVVCNEGFYSTHERDYINAHMASLSVNYHQKLVDALKATLHPDYNDMAKTDADVEAADALLAQIEAAKAEAISNIKSHLKEAEQHD